MSYTSRLIAPLGAALLAVSMLGACSRGDTTPAANAAAAPHAAPSATAQLEGPAGQDTASTASDRGRIKGVERSPVWLIEISDFQCPYCKQWHDNAYAAIDREYVQTGKVRMAFINFPIPSLHPNATAASEAAMCASAQGKFWELHDALFETQEGWAAMRDPMPKFDSLAVAAKVDPTAWRKCMSSHATAALIAADRERASRSGVQSTPSFFIGKRAMVGAFPVDSFRVALDAAIAAAGGTR